MGKEKVKNNNDKYNNNIFKVTGWCRPKCDIHLKRVYLSTSKHGQTKKTW